tara:strand:- start:10375 stop:11181 length:807 start_codon:yes stop_codon:yes gene_type:complete
MAISSWISDRDIGASQVLQGRDLALDGLETVLSCSLVDASALSPASTVVGDVAAGSLTDHFKAFHVAVDAAINNALTAEMSYRGGYAASAAITSLTNVKKGDMFTVTAAGDGGGGGSAYFTTASLEVGDVIIAEVANADNLAQENWTIVSQDLNAVQAKIDTIELEVGLTAAGVYTAVGGTYANGDSIRADVGTLNAAIVGNDTDIATNLASIGELTGSLAGASFKHTGGSVNADGAAYTLQFGRDGGVQLILTRNGSDVDLTLAVNS